MGTASTHDGWGAQVAVRTPDGRVQHTEYGSTTHYAGQSELTAHFGLGAATAVDEVRVTWPSGRVTTLRPGSAVDRVVTIEEGT